MARFKLVNGVKIAFSPAEELARDAEEAAFAAAPIVAPAKPRVELIEAALIEKGALTKADIDGAASK